MIAMHPTEDVEPMLSNTGFVMGLTILMLVMIVAIYVGTVYAERRAGRRRFEDLSPRERRRKQ